MGSQSTPAKASLRSADLAATPMALFARWFNEARDSGEAEPEAMALSTAGAGGVPSCRFVLLKAADERGFVFFTNYRSAKGREIDANPVAALAFRWQILGRQVRAVGRVDVLSAGESDSYFATRARGSRLGAWASPQSQVLTGRAQLERRLQQVTERYAGADVPRPPWWGGLRVVPDAVEFWQGRADRLHDRFLYRRSDAGWVRERLAP